MAAALKVPVAQAVDSLGQAKALWMDETHYPREGAGNWVWAAVQPLLAVFAIYPCKRSANPILASSPALC